MATASDLYEKGGVTLTSVPACVWRAKHSKLEVGTQRAASPDFHTARLNTAPVNGRHLAYPTAVPWREESPFHCVPETSDWPLSPLFLDLPLEEEQH